MKILKSSTFIIAGLAILFSLSGCKDKSQLLLKTWKLEDMTYTSEVPKGMQSTVDKSVAEMKSSVLLTYNADGTYLTEMKDRQLHGKWKLNWNSSKLTSVDDNGNSVVYNIKELSDNKFSFIATEGKQEVLFVMAPAK
ncbi:MAG TPA: lipocalin family protein [Chitinophagales bacterium]|nr:lipocalin family protein [Chitinophagales bacterium]